MILEPDENSRKRYTVAVDFLRKIRRYRKVLSSQQMSTLRGQALAGDLDGAERGLHNILAKVNRRRAMLGRPKNTSEKSRRVSGFDSS